jgi:Ca-activated chloride channel homolog
VRRAAAVSALLLVVSAGAAAQQTAAPPPAAVSQLPPPPATQESTRQVFRTATNLVPLNVTVVDNQKHFVTGLTASDFKVFEDGVEQRVEFFEARQVPLDLIILLDTSSSMSDKMDVVHEAAIGFVKTMRPGDRGAVVTFADNVNVVQSLTSDVRVLEDAVRQTVPRGATALYNAIYVALKQFGQRSDETIRRQAIAVLSDGEDTSSLIMFDDVLAVARKMGVAIYPIALKSKYAASRVAAVQRGSFSQSEYSMRTLALDTGAQAFFPTHVFELKNIYASIAQELSSQYSIAYAPTNPRVDGRFRRILVRIVTRPELKLRTRTGYTADNSR